MIDPGEGRVLIESAPLEQPSVRAFLTSSDPVPEGTAERWLINVRWLAIGGMTATTVVASRLVPALETFPIYTILGALALTNVVLALVVGAFSAEPFTMKEWKRTMSTSIFKAA